MDQVARAPGGKPRLATAWLGGCSGCHMSFLDLDEALIDLAGKVTLVFGPLVDVKEYPEDVDIALVEGALANEENLELLKTIRARTRCLIAFGDCAVTGNVSALRNPLGGSAPVLTRAYVDAATTGGGIPAEEGLLPVLLDRVRPLHDAVKVDLFLPGCPPSAELIGYVVGELVAGRKPDLAGRLKYG